LWGSPQEAVKHMTHKPWDNPRHAYSMVKVMLEAMGTLVQTHDERKADLTDKLEHILAQHLLELSRIVTTEVLKADIKVGMYALQTGTNGCRISKVDLIIDEFSIAEIDHFPA
jgi:hypothetical protein